MKTAVNFDLGLELTKNSKVGPAFSLSRSESCINKTEVCERVCYGNGIRYRSSGQTAKRSRNFRTAEFLIRHGGLELLAENLMAIIDQARPIDYFVASIDQTSTAVPWTLRIHDVGDFYSVQYIRAWKLAAERRPHCKFWFYTRSFKHQILFEELTELASLDNVSGFLSLDTVNYDVGMLRFSQAEAGVWKLALLQEEPLSLADGFLEQVKSLAEKHEVVVFPKHHGGRHVAPLVDKNYTVCPQVVGGLKLESRPNLAKPCQTCAFCLP